MERTSILICQLWAKRTNTLRYGCKRKLEKRSASEKNKKSATLAEKAIGGTRVVEDTAKHQYASKLLNRYQR